MVVHDRANLRGVPFHKLTGSGNDFVFFDGRSPAVARLETPDVIARLCRRGTGVGADGVVWLLPAEPPAAFRMRYRNSDGSIADMCGNASLCAVRLAITLGLAPAGEPFSFATDAGRLIGRMRADGRPEVQFYPLRNLAESAPPPPAEGERRIGFVDSGVPHLVVEVGDVAHVDLPVRGAALRASRELGPAGANVNFVAATGPDRFRMRTFERGVEGETLACGTGAVASAAVLLAWRATSAETTIETTSGLELLVSLHESDGNVTPSLAGEGRIVFSGDLVDV